MQTGTRDGFTFERGTSTFRVTGRMFAHLEQLGIADVLRKANPESHERFLLKRDGLAPVPLGPGSLISTDLLSAGGKLRMLKEPFISRGAGSEETVDEFVTRRLGRETLEGLVAPFLVGVYAGDVTKLGAEAVFPALVANEQRGGSIVGGALLGALSGPRGPKAPAGSFSAEDGTSSLIERLVAALGAGVVRTGVRVEAVEPGTSGYRVSSAGETLQARQVVLAVEAPNAADLLRPFSPEAAVQCGGVAYQPMVSLALDIDPARASRPIQGLGFLVPEETGIELLGGLFMSRLFPGRAPAGRELVSAMIGGARWPEAVEADEATLLQRAQEGLDLALGTGDAPSVVAVNRWPRAIPQPGRDHPARIRQLRSELARYPALEIAGGWADGVAVARAMESGIDAAERILSRGAR
jgi:oxygen-dependent protoporphyrinogen oxidase